MKTRHLVRIVAVALFASLFTACSNDDAVRGVVEIGKMDGVDLSQSQCRTTLNGEEVAIKGVEFACDGAGEAVTMTISGLTAELAKSFTVDIDAVPGERTVGFTGKSDAPGYEMTVRGTYTPAEKYVTDGYVVLDIAYAPKGIETGRTFVFKTGEGFLNVTKDILGTTKYDGIVYPNEMTIRNALVSIGKYLGTKHDEIGMRFNEDLTLDIWIKPAGGDEPAHWMTTRYWFTENDGELILELTDEQCDAFCEAWTGIPQGPYTPIFIFGLDDRVPLAMFYEMDGGRLSIGIANTQNAAALSMFADGFGRTWPESQAKTELMVARDAMWNAIRDGQQVEIAMTSEPGD